LRDGTFRFSLAGQPIGAHCVLGSFSGYSVVLEESCVPVDAEVPLQVAALVSCGVVTGWGAVVHAGATTVGDTVVVVGTGGVGINAVQAAALAGALNVIAVDPLEFKRAAAAACGATHQVATAEEAAELARALNPSAGGADVTILSSGTTSQELMTGAFATTGRGGTLVVVGLGSDFGELNMRLAASQLAVNEKRIQGCLMGSSHFVRDIPMIIEFYKRGRIRLDQLVSKVYPLGSINEGFADMLAGRTIRGMIGHAH
jgi:S-(hydroxymethyl)glutathione dehydrogenase/alcohol dehydrogenase